MFKTLVCSISFASAAAVGLMAVPAAAQDRSYHYSESYEDEDGSYRRSETFRGHARDSYEVEDDDHGRYRSYERRTVEYAPDQYYREPAYRYSSPRHRHARCTSGTTGAIVGAAVGGLLGREIGRGGPWNEPSTTGLILGAGAGALAGRQIERNGCR